jgi:hypothetical protein
MQSINNLIVLEVKKWIGTPFHQQGRQIGVGCDCIGLIIGVAKSIRSLSLTGKSWEECDKTTYDCMTESALLIDLLPIHFKVVKSSFKVGNILLIEISQKQYHACIVTSVKPTKIIHSCGALGKVVEHKIIPQWLDKIRMIYRFQ